MLEGSLQIMPVSQTELWSPGEAETRPPAWTVLLPCPPAPSREDGQSEQRVPTASSVQLLSIFT